MGHQRVTQRIQSQRIPIGEQVILVPVNRFVEAMLEIQIRKYVQVGRSRGKINRHAAPGGCRYFRLFHHVIAALRNRINRVCSLQLPVSPQNGADTATVEFCGTAHGRQLLPRTVLSSLDPLLHFG
ncbi:hypothetical protein D3C75_968460 [compost metagenome]